MTDAKDLVKEYELMSDEDVISLSRNGDKYAIDHIINKYKNLVRSRARTYFLIGADKEDIVQEGMIGLYKAARDFKIEKHVSFKAFAELCITRQIISAIKSATRQKHIPLNSYISLNKPFFEDENEQTLLDTLGQRKNSNPEDIVITKEHFESVEEKMFKVLSKFERKVLSLYLDGKGYTEIAKQLDKSEKSIDNALQRIKRKVTKFIHNI